MTEIPPQRKNNKRKYKHGCKVLLAAVLLIGFLMAGCTGKPYSNFPFYEYQAVEGVLDIDGTLYMEALGIVVSQGSEGNWVFTGEVTEAIGVCGRKQENGGEYLLYMVGDDERQDLLFARPNQFTFGPYREFVLLREGIQLENPMPETVSHMVVVYRDQDSDWIEKARTSDLVLIEELLQLYNRQASKRPLPDGTFEIYELKLYHSKYHSLYFILRSYYDTESGTAYLKCADGNYRRLPQGFESLIHAGEK